MQCARQPRCAIRGEHGTWTALISCAGSSRAGERSYEMLRSLHDLKNDHLDCTDGELGRVDDFLIDDLSWTVRYLVADTRKWLPGRRVLISPLAVGRANWTTRRVPVGLTRQQVEDSPPLDEHAPVARQRELALFEHFNWRPDPGSDGAWTIGLMPNVYYYHRLTQRDEGEETEGEQRSSPEERAETEYGGHLRSMLEMERYSFDLADADVGHLEDIVIDDAWIVRYLVADLRRWLPGGRKVLIAPQWIEGVDWGERRIAVDMTEEQLKSCPDYDPRAPVNRVYEQRLYDFHGRPVYWS